MGPRDGAPGWEVGEGGQLEGPEADRTSVPVSDGSSATPVPLGAALGADRIICQARRSGLGASGPWDCSGGPGGCGGVSTAGWAGAGLSRGP